MGVHGLWKLLESSGRPINPESLEGKILAVDISIWLNQAVKGVRARDGSSVQNAHLLTLFHRVCKLLYFRVRPVFVFDGDAPLLKRQTLAVRRQRREELTRESKQTNEKLLKTFLKRRAIQAVLGEQSEEPVLSLSNVRKDEEDIYILPALPVVDKENRSEDEERSGDHKTDSHHMYQGEMHGDPNSVDINGEEFSDLPLEVRHQILKDMKEFSKRRRTMYQPPPECSRDFSQYQLEGLLQRKHLNHRLVEVEREMNHNSAGAGPQLCGDQDHSNQNQTIETRRLLSEDSTHYILIKGGQKKKAKVPDNQPAALPWSGGPLSGARRPREEEEEEEKQASSSSSAPTPNHLPPSPRTLQAIQAAMESGSEEEQEQLGRRRRRSRSVSPRTALAIQQALAEEGEGEEAGPLPTLPPTTLQLPTPSAPQLPTLTPPPVQLHTPTPPPPPPPPPPPKLPTASPPQLDSSATANSRPGMTIPTNQKGRGVVLSGGWLDSSSEEEEVEEVIREEVPREENKLGGRRTVEETSDRSKPGEKLPEPIKINEEREGEEGDVVLVEEEEEEEDEGVMDDGSDSEGTLTSACVRTQLCSLYRHCYVDEVCRNDVVLQAELEALESCLEEEQASLRQQKDKQERTAASVSGQMCLESQELLRMFGVPYMVAPSEAEAQCACLDRRELTHGTITDDSDVWLFGGRHVYRNFFSQSKYIEHYQYTDLHNQLGLDRSKLINMAYLLGSDYTDGVPGVGYVTGMEILNEFPGPNLEPLTQLSTWWSAAKQRKASDPRDSKVKKKLRSLQLTAGFPNPLIAQAYLHPTVDQSESAFSWGRPHLEQIKEFCQSRFGWTNKKTDEALQPVIKQLNSQQSQPRIDSFFRQEQQEQKEVRSTRLRRAVTCMKRKEREEREEQTEESLSPSKCKQAKPAEGRKEVSVGGGEGGGGGGGFLGAEVRGEGAPLSSPRKRREEEVPRTPPTGAEEPARSSLLRGEERGEEREEESSGSDNSSDGGRDVTMVTAKSVFEGSRGGRSRGGRGRGGRRGRAGGRRGRL
uniref:Excision repair cross-complementation group 5 n=1 Tax=Gadus morhua TaxID=8049 RepID=A0A8C5C763_GADMO